MEKLRLWLYYFKHAFGSILANRLVYFVSTATISISLLLFGAFVLIFANFSNWVQGWEKSLSLSVYLEDMQREQQAEEIRKAIESWPGAEVKAFISKEKAMKDLAETLGSQAGLLQGLTDLEKEIEEQRKSLRELEESAVRIKKELVEGEARLAELENALTNLETRLGRRLDAFYRYAKRGYARLFTNAGGFDALRKGILIEALHGGEVKAVYSGRVDFSGSLEGYGQVIVNNHGGRYFTVSAQLGKRARETGEKVEAGDVIGVLAESSRLQGGDSILKSGWGLRPQIP